MSLYIFKNIYVESLLTEVPRNVSKYGFDASWAQAEAPENSSLATKLMPPNDAPLALPVGTVLKDYENSIKVYRMFPDLTPVQARDPRLWARLCHEEFWEYMRLRWDAREYEGHADKQVRYIKAHYFVSQAQSRALLRNGIARLWWYAHLTRDESRENPYELTEMLLSTLDITQQVLERSLGRSKDILFGFLSFLVEWRDDQGAMKRGDIRELAKRLNMTGGVTLLDALSAVEISSLMRDEARMLVKLSEVDSDKASKDMLKGSVDDF